MTDDLKNALKKKTEGHRNVRFVACCLSNQGIYSHQFSKLLTNFVNRWCY